MCFTPGLPLTLKASRSVILSFSLLASSLSLPCHWLLDCPDSTVWISTSSSPSTSLSAPPLPLSPPPPTHDYDRSHAPAIDGVTHPHVAPRHFAAAHLAAQSSIPLPSRPFVDNPRHDILIPYSSHRSLLLFIPSAAERAPNWSKSILIHAIRPIIGE